MESGKLRAGHEERDREQACSLPANDPFFRSFVRPKTGLKTPKKPLFQYQNHLFWKKWAKKPLFGYLQSERVNANDERLE